MLCHVVSFLFLFLMVSADSLNSFHKQTPTEKPDILLEDPSIPKSLNPPTHISEFTDPDTGLNPFLDLEEGPTLMGRNVMKDETRQDPPFIDFEMVEGEGSNRRWLDLDLPKEPIEESIPRWIPFEEGTKIDEKFLPSSATAQSTTTSPETTNESSTVLLTTVPDEIDNDNEIDVDNDQKIIRDYKITVGSNNTIIYASMAVVISVMVFVFFFGSCWWRRRKIARTRSRVSDLEKGELKC